MVLRNVTGTGDRNQLLMHASVDSNATLHDRISHAFHLAALSLIAAGFKPKAMAFTVGCYHQRIERDGTLPTLSLAQAHANATPDDTNRSIVLYVATVDGLTWEPLTLGPAAAADGIAGAIRNGYSHAGQCDTGRDTAYLTAAGCTIYEIG